MHYNTLLYGKTKNIATLNLINPPGNVMSMKFFDELLDVCENEIINEDFKGLIISSKGRHFSSGADVKELLNIVKNSDRLVPGAMEKNLRAIEILHKVSKPKVAVLKGICYGSGFELALTANYRIAQKNILIALPEVSYGLMPGLGGISTLTAIIGGGKTLEFTLTGRAINSEEALSLGLVDEICNKEEIEEKAKRIIYANNKIYESQIK